MAEPTPTDTKTSDAKTSHDDLEQVIKSLREISDKLGKIIATEPSAAPLTRAIDNGLRFFSHI
jgi:hypothetical protein